MNRLAAAFAPLWCVMACAGCLRPPIDEPPTPPTSDVARISQLVVANYAGGLAESFATAADQLEAGELTTAAETNGQLQSANASARKQAFLALDEMLNDELGGERWNAQHAAKIFREIADGLRAACIANERKSVGAIAPSP